eukprot:4866182-Pyramimonas_sp.AAC.1
MPKSSTSNSLLREALRVTSHYKPGDGGARQQPIFAGPESPQRLVRRRSRSGRASSKRPRVPARVQARVEVFLAALQKRCGGTPQCPSGASLEYDLYSFPELAAGSLRVIRTRWRASTS